MLSERVFDELVRRSALSEALSNAASRRDFTA